MGRQAYLNRLALGRSPYEAPENTTAELTGPTQRRVSPLHGDGYVQQYDERGHPVNVESKALGRDLRRAKNDILSTMGIVVSGKDGNAVVSNEQHNVDLITAENDYGLILATLDQVLVFLGSWWTTSLTGRIQTFKRYTHFHLLKTINFERSSVGMLGFYFSGIPAWAVSTCISICRHQPLERLVNFLQDSLLQFSPNDVVSRFIRSSFSLLHSAARGSLLVLAVQTYVYSLLQSLHLVNPCSFPPMRFLIPFGERVHLPPLPADLSLRSVGNFGLGLLTTPPILVYLSLYFRPVVEMRLYKLIRRRLPKPTHADEVSIKVAFDNDLIDWMVPSLGRKSEEEIVRSRLTLVEDIMNETQAFRAWASWWFGFRRSDPDSDHDANVSPNDQRIESLRHCVEELREELNAAQSRAHLSQQQSTTQMQAAPHHGGVWPSSSGPTAAAHIPEPDSTFPSSRFLSNEENRISQSPDEMSADGIAEMAPLRRARSVPSIEPANRAIPRGDGAPANRRNSRSNTLFSRPSSPESSPPTSPRVRASLIHQNSEIITMQLELLSHRNPQNQNQSTLRAGDQGQILDENGTPADRRSIAEFLDNIISNQGQNLSTLLNSDAVDSDGLSGLTAGASPAAGDSLADVVSSDQRQNIATNTVSESPAEPPVVRPANILPDDVEEPGPEPTHNNPEAETEIENIQPLESLPHPTSDHHPHDQNRRGGPHRVTILSSHPLDSLASHMSSMITSVIFMPLESLYLRSLASHFLSSRGAPPALQSDVVRRLSIWPGGESKSEILPYLGKLGLIFGMQAAVNASVWGIITGAAIRIGKSCGWGKL